MIKPLKFLAEQAIATDRLRTRRGRFCYVLFAGCISLAGCSSWHWEKQGASDDDYALDEKNCKVQSYSGTDGMVTQASVRKMHNCLQAKGWRKVNK